MTAADSDRPPSGCQWCGLARHGHFRTWSSERSEIHGNGWHAYEHPTIDQVKERMLARRREVLDRRATDTMRRQLLAAVAEHGTVQADLAKARTAAERLFGAFAAVNDATGQRHAQVREALTQASIALSGLDKAAVHAGALWPA